MEKLNTGDTAWLLVATAFVVLMTVPGLALFYGGLTRAKSILNTLMMNLTTFFLVSIVWVIIGYTLAFGPSIAKFVGGLSKFGLKGITVDTLSGTIPEFLFVAFQLTFAAITTALISGAVIERMKFSGWVLFSILWVILVYSPVAHWVWGGGFLGGLGALDFAGGTVVHINAGVAAVALALALGRRREEGILPANMPLVALGAGLLLFGWFGFNAGSALSASGQAASALLVTNTAASTAAVTWMFIEWMHRGKPTLLGVASGIIAGLVGITPAAGFVNVWGAIAIGVLSAAVSYLMVVVLKSSLPWDDSLDVFGIHGMSGIAGSILTGVFADPAIGGAKGLLYGNPKQVVIQVVSIIAVIIYSFVITFIIAKVVDAITGLRVDEESEREGLDESQHGERAYNLMAER